MTGIKRKTKGYLTHEVLYRSKLLLLNFDLDFENFRVKYYEVRGMTETKPVICSRTADFSTDYIRQT